MANYVMYVYFHHAYAFTYRLTYWLTSSLKALSKDYNLAFHTIHVEYVNFIHEWRDLQFKVEPEVQRENDHAFFQKTEERNSSKKNIFSYFVFRI